MKTTITEFKTACIATITLGVLLCFVYPVLIWGIGQLTFPGKANGSLVYAGGRVVGSALIAQPFTGAGYLHPRPSAAGQGYDGSSSGGSNYGPLSKALSDQISERVRQYRSENLLSLLTPVPADAVTTSASGLDPHISVPNALLQAGRIAAARHIAQATIVSLIKAHTEGRDFGIFGEPCVNVLLVNLALDQL